MKWLAAPAFVCCAFFVALPGAHAGVPSDDPPITVPSGPLLQVPQGCPSPPVAAVVFIGRVVVKDFRVVRFQVEQVRAGNTAGYEQGGLIDIRYGNEVEYLNGREEYLVGAAVQGPDLALTSKVRAAEPLYGGNAVVGLTERSNNCPVIEDPVRTFHVDGSEIEASLLKGLSNSKKEIALAFAKPILAVLAILFGLALVRWVLTALYVAVRRAAEASRA